MKKLNFIAVLSFIVIAFVSCKKYNNIGDAPYPEQSVYMPAAIEGNSIGGIYRISSVAVLGQGFRYVADVPGKKLNIPLAAYRSGVNNRGSVPVSVSANTDTISKLIVAGKLPAGTELLPADKYTLTGNIIIADGKGYEDIILSVNQDFLLANLTKKFAIAVAVAITQKVPGRFATTIVFIDPTFLVPVANFTRTISTRTVNFSNTSVNANAWMWDYGDGTTVSTEKALPHVYANAGTYTITLTAAGALGDFNKSIFTSTVIIP